MGRGVNAGGGREGGRHACSATSPRVRGEVGVRAFHARAPGEGALPRIRALLKRPLTPTLSVEVGYIRLRPINNAEIGQARFRMHAGRGSAGSIFAAARTATHSIRRNPRGLGERGVGADLGFHESIEAGWRELHRVGAELLDGVAHRGL